MNYFRTMYKVGLVTIAACAMPLHAQDNTDAVVDAGYLLSVGAGAYKDGRFDVVGKTFVLSAGVLYSKVRGPIPGKDINSGAIQLDGKQYIGCVVNDDWAPPKCDYKLTCVDPNGTDIVFTIKPGLAGEGSIDDGKQVRIITHGSIASQCDDNLFD
ncbi:MAG: hypothetical protein EOM24_24570 [Chloroflexia bacterium]|nr:hypothetical protein [Chloroflexia bacterium]